MPSPSPTRLTFRKRHRLTHATEFEAVYDLRLKRSRGPLTIFARPNTFASPRLGLSVGRRVGNAVTRNSVKRKLREAFRHLQHDLPHHSTGRYDLIINVRAHRLYPLGTYRELLADLANSLHAEALRRKLITPPAQDPDS